MMTSLGSTTRNTGAGADGAAPSGRSTRTGTKLTGADGVAGDGRLVRRKCPRWVSSLRALYSAGTDSPCSRA